MTDTTFSNRTRREMREARNGSSATIPLADDLAIYSLPPAGDAMAWALASSVANDGLWYFDVDLDEMRLAPRALELLGYQADERPPEWVEVAHHVHRQDLVLLQRAIGEAIRGERARVELELRLVTTRGETRWTLLRARALHASDGHVIFIAGSLADIDERKRAALQLRQDSRHDPLTGLPNRIALNEYLVARIGRSTGNHKPGFAVLYADLDRFKFVNDSLGHAAGDALLLETTRRIESVLGENDMLARIGGDEFVIVLDKVESFDRATAIAEAIQQVMGAAVPLGDEEVFAAVSVGIRVTQEPGCKPSELLRDADIAMYEAKRQGGGRTIGFDDEMYPAMVERLRTQSALHRGARLPG